jgi:hypothetical protein
MNPAEFVRQVKMPTRMVVASKTNSGKSVLVGELVLEFLKQRKVDLAVVYSNTARLNESDYAFLPKKLVRPFDPQDLNALLERQSKTPKPERKQILLILDDLLGDSRANNNDSIMKAYTMGRHIGIHPILISQQGNKLLTPTIRNQADYFIISRINRQGLIQIWEDSVGFMDKDDFIKFVEMANRDYTFVVLDNTSNSNSPEDFLQLLRADNKSLPRHKDWDTSA